MRGLRFSAVENMRGLLRFSAGKAGAKAQIDRMHLSLWTKVQPPTKVGGSHLLEA